MANETAGAVPANEGDGPTLSLQSVYLKDCSYEAPNGPRVEGNWSPQISLDLQTATTMVTPELREVVLTVTVAAKQNEATVFLVEVKQAGLFVMRGLAEPDVKRLSKISSPECRSFHSILCRHDFSLFTSPRWQPAES